VKRLLVLATLALLAVPAARAATNEGVVAPPASWAAPEIAAVTGAGLLGADPAAFRPDDAITEGELVDAIHALGLRTKPTADPTRVVTLRELDARLVGALGLTPAARRIRLAARDAGLHPPAWLGTETVARLADLRLNHPFGSDGLEVGPNDAVSRAEAAYSLSRILRLQVGDADRIAAVAGTFALPAFTDWQRAVLTRAVQFVGLPYVWTGTSERPQAQWTADGTAQTTVPGGFDCSGFVWRVYKVKPFATAPVALESTLKGRTTYEMSGEVPAEERIAQADLQPGDVLFFGSHGPASTPAEVIHSGIYVGNGWFVHSSSHGVTMAPLADWYARTFAWARRPLAEAGLTV
jgi:hypothetical protein